MWTYRREAARVVLLDPQDRVLLLRARDPAKPARGEWWELPGGGIEPGESSAVAAARELYEETGLADVEMGSCVWRHHARFTFSGIRFDQQEQIHVARWKGSAEETYRPGGLEALEALAFGGMAWWDVEDVRGLVQDGGLVIPPWLPEQLPLFLAAELGEHPVDLGELGDVFGAAPG